MSLHSSARIILLAILASLLVCAPCAAAIGSETNPQSGPVGLEGTVPGAPPKQAATIGIPSNGQVFTSTPITVSGLCKTGLLVKVFSNNIFVGSAICTNGSYSLKIDLFSGHNDLVARIYDTLDQQGPDSNVVGVTFNDAQFAQFGTHVTLTSQYARRGANPGSALAWPFILGSGKGPYALSVTWGDGTTEDLKSVALPGTITFSHTYTQAGTYIITAKATDANGASAYLQVVGVANGKISGSVSGGSSPTPSTQTIILWQPLLAVVPLLPMAFWLGKRHELHAIRHAIEENREVESRS